MASPAKTLTRIRGLMKDKKYVPEALQAYIIPSADAHTSEYLAKHDMRREFVTGFTGSSGTAVITTDKALLWVDSRYFLQADQEVDPAVWTVMKDGIADVPPMSKWLAKNLPRDSKIGVDPMLMSASAWNDLTKKLVYSGQSLVAVPQNLVDLVWEKQPDRPKERIDLHPLEYSGKAWREKVDEVREEMLDAGADVVIITELDEVAWLFNLRGKDIQFNPVFFSYGAVTIDSTHLFVESERMEMEAKVNLTKPDPKKGTFVTLHPYDEIRNFLSKQVEEEKKVLISPRANMALTSMIPSGQLISGLTPIATLKAVKNPVERKGMRTAHMRDGAALVRFLAWLDFQMKNNKRVTECSAADKAEDFRRMQKGFVSLSFPTISSVGPNAAIVHYRPDPNKDVQLTKAGVYLIDSGAQYRDGTTDITRTVHFGSPTAAEKDAFTRVLKGHIGLATAVFPSKTRGNALDSFARRSLWEKGMNYGHGTGHGIGSYLNVHEGPSGISFRPHPNDPGILEGMFFSNEPGYYEDGKFGIRIENIVEVVKAKTQHSFQGKDFLTFETVSYCPLQQSLIDPSLLTAEEIEWINDYHAEVRDFLAPRLRADGDDMAVSWLNEQTRPMG